MPKTRGATWDSLFLTFVKLVTILTTIAQGKILSVGLSLTDNGTYEQANLIISLGTSIMLLGLGDAINYFYNDASCENNYKNKQAIINTIFGIELIIGTVFSIIVVACKDLIAGYFSNGYLASLLLLVSFQPVLDNLIYFYQVLFVSTGKARIIAIRNFIVSLCKLAMIAMAVYIFKSVKIIFVALLLLNLTQLIVFALLFKKDEFSIVPFKIRKKDVKQILSYAIPMGVFTITSALIREIDKLVIGKMANTETLAIYSKCSKLLPLDIIVVSFATVLIPYIMKYISNGNIGEAVKLFSNYLKIGYYSVWTFGVTILTVSNQAITFLYSEEYVPGKWIFIIYIFDSMVKFASMHLILTANGETKLLMKYSLLSLLANLILNILLYGLLGMVGPALATLLVTTIYSFLILKRSKSILKTKWKEIFNIKDLLTFVIGLIVFASIFATIHYCLMSININQYVSMLISMFGFCATILLIYRKRVITALKMINSLK